MKVVVRTRRLGGSIITRIPKEVVKALVILVLNLSGPPAGHSKIMMPEPLCGKKSTYS